MARVTIVLNVERKSGYRCAECSEFVELEAVESPLYECSNCDKKFDRNNSADGGSNRCPECNKFAARIADCACPECGEGELETVDGFECGECDEFVSVDDFPEHLAEHYSGEFLEGTVEDE